MMSSGVGDASTPVPVTLLTGFLGAGKTTLLRRVLEQTSNARIAVLVNEFGVLGIDTDRIGSTRGPVIEMLNGCICCASEGDLLRGLDTLLRDEARIDAILVETSGLADPWPVVDALAGVRLTKEIALSAVVTLVDAENFDDNLEHAEAAFQQLTAADLLLINKVDLVTMDVVALVEQRLRQLNPGATVIATRHADLPLAAIASVSHDVATLAPQRGHRHDHASFEAAALTADTPLDLECFDRWLASLPGGIIRMKGTISFAGADRPTHFDRVGSRVSVNPASTESPATGASQVVVIGRDLDRDELQSCFEGCSK